MQVGDGSISFKINNNYSAFYSRQIYERCIHNTKDSFELDIKYLMTGLMQPELPELTPQDYEYTNDRYLA